MGAFLTIKTNPEDGTARVDNRIILDADEVIALDDPANVDIGWTRDAKGKWHPPKHPEDRIPNPND